MPSRPRYELDNACVMKGWNDADLAARLDPKVNAETVRRWRTGEQTPYKYHITQMCVLFEVKHPKELNLDAQFNASTQSREESIAVYRRELFEHLRAASIVAGVDPVVLLHATVDDPKEFLRACRVVLDECWDFYDQSRYTLADSTITVLMPGLRDLAMQKSPHQHNAASLAIEAKVLQINIATMKEDYERRVLLGSDIVVISETSGDKNLHAMALGWHGNTYVNCYFIPETAIAIYKSALSCLNDVSPLNQADVYMGLATACALDEKDTDKEAKKAREYVALARLAMPDNPEADPLYPVIGTGQAELDMREGKMNLILARRFPSQKEYAQRAHGIFVGATGKQFLDRMDLGGTLIYRADAARSIGDMRDYFDSLEEGLPIVQQIRGDREITHAIAALQNTPRGWRNEKRYQDLDAIVREIMTPRKIKQ
jgi:hypothetical protein